MKKKYTFIEILNNTRGKKLIECLEEVIRDANNGNTDKQKIAESYAEELLDKFGYDYLEIHKKW